MSEHWAVKVIREAEEAGFFGTLELRFRAGRVELITKSETILPPHINGKNPREMTTSGKA
jgi:hypothetical protein